MATHEVEGLKRFLLKKGGSNYYVNYAQEEREWLEGILYSNGILNTLVFNLLFS